MTLIPPVYLAPGSQSGRRIIKNVVNLSVDVTADATNVGTGTAIVIPSLGDGGILRGLFLVAAAPAGTAGGAKTVQVSVGSAANDNTTLAGTDVDVMVASGAKTAAFVHGDAADDHVDGYFPIDDYGKYFATDLTIYLNFIGQSATATATNGTVTLSVEVYAFVDYLA